MTVECVSDNFFYIAKERLLQTDEKISRCICAAKVFITIAFFFNPWTIGTVVPLKYIITSWAVFSAFSAVGLIATVYFYAKNLLVAKDIKQQISNKNKEILDQFTRNYERAINAKPPAKRDNVFVFPSEPLLTVTQSTLKSFERPLGLKNASNNCWANALFQFFMNIPRYRRLLRTCPHKLYDKISLSTLIDQYRKDQINLRSISKVKSQYLREIVHLESPSFNTTSSNQEDSSEAFNYLSDWLPKNRLRCTTTYCSEGLPSPDLAGNLTEQNERGYSLQLSDNNRFSSSYTENESCLNLDIIPQSGEMHLKALLDHFFEPELIENAKSQFLSSSLAKISYPLISRDVKFVSAPKDLCIFLKRFSSVDVISNQKVKRQSIKKKEDVIVPLRLSLKKSKHTLDENGDYLLDSFIVHFGKCESGHYKAYVKKNEKWFECNDVFINEISEVEALKKAKQAYIIHYSKVSASSRV